MDFLVIPLNMLIVFGTIYKLFELFVRKQERLLVINKITEISKVDLRNIDIRMGSKSNWAIRIGALMIGVGLGLFIGFFLNGMFTNGDYWSGDVSRGYWDLAELVYGSCVCFFGGIALLIAYAVERSNQKKDKEEDKE
jgi:hypothetical protein